MAKWLLSLFTQFSPIVWSQLCDHCSLRIKKKIWSRKSASYVLLQSSAPGCVRWGWEQVVMCCLYLYRLRSVGNTLPVTHTTMTRLTDPGGRWWGRPLYSQSECSRVNGADAMCSTDCTSECAGMSRIFQHIGTDSHAIWRTHFISLILEHSHWLYKGRPKNQQTFVF